MRGFCMFTKSKIKIVCIVAWLHRELAMAEIATRKGKCKVVIENVEFIRANGILILNHWHKEGWTFKNLFFLQQKIRKIKEYYEKIDKSIQKTISQNKDLDLSNNWIPMYLTLAIAKKWKDENVEIFPSYIDVQKMIDVYSQTDKIDKRTKFVYWRLARTILEDMRKMK